MSASSGRSREVGAFEAKAHLSRLLREVERGSRFTITVRGRPVAALVPLETSDRQARATAVKAMQDFPRVDGVEHQQLMDWIQEGRT
jgi:prevent-host-death family protein